MAGGECFEPGMKRSTRPRLVTRPGNDAATDRAAPELAEGARHRPGGLAGTDEEQIGPGGSRPMREHRAGIGSLKKKCWIDGVDRGAQDAAGVIA